MARAGYCAECGSNVWLNEHGGCPQGHDPSSVSGAYEVTDATAHEPTQPAAPTPAPTAGPPGPKRNRGGLIAALAIIGLLVVGGAIGAFMLLGGSPGDAIMQAAADHDAAVFTGDWEGAAAVSVDSLHDDLARQEEQMVEFLPPDGSKGSESRRYTDGDYFVLETIHEGGPRDGKVERRYYKRMEPDSNTLVVYGEAENPDGDLETVAGYYVDMVEDGGDWKVAGFTAFMPDEIEALFDEGIPK